MPAVIFIEKKHVYLLHTCTSVSRANSRSVRSRWCMGDHLNSGMRNIVVRGPGLNCRRCSSVIGIPRNPRSTRRSLSGGTDRPWTAWRNTWWASVDCTRNSWFQNENHQRGGEGCCHMWLKQDSAPLGAVHPVTPEQKPELKGLLWLLLLGSFRD